MTSSGPSQPRSLPLLGIVFAALVVVGTIVWLADPFAPSTAIAPTGGNDANGATVHAGTSDADANSDAPATAPAERSLQPIAANRARMVGRVLLGNAPLPGATVCLTRDRATTTLTANDGTFVLDVPPGLSRLAITGEGTPRDAHWGPVVVAPGQSFALGDVVVPLPASVRGRIVDELGGPVVDALVVTSVGGSTWAADRTDRQAPDFPPHAISDADGRFRIAGLSPHESSLQVERAGYQYGWQPYELTAGQDLDLGLVVLNSRRALHGVVFGPNGAPLAGARVVAGGTRNDPLRQRSAVTTDVRGTFILDPRSGDLVTVFADGCDPTTVQHEVDAPLHVTLSAAHVLHGIVTNAQGKAGFVRIAPNGYEDRSQMLRESIVAPTPIADDGSFAIANLPAGQWRCFAEVPGHGRSAFVTVTMPGSEQVRLELIQQRSVRLSVRDDLGATVPEAVVKASTRYPGTHSEISSSIVELDHNGSARIDVLAGHEPELAVSSIHHAPVQRSLAPGENDVTVVMPRLGAVAGMLSSSAYSTHCRLVVQAKTAKGTHAGNVDADRDGRYRLPLAAGDYHVELIAIDSSHFAKRERPVATPVPLVSEFESLGASIPVTVRSGEITNVDLAVPTFAEITGRVLVRGQPLADAIVYASSERDRERARNTGPDRHTYHPHQRTDAAGTFRFLVSSGREVHLHARHGRSGEWSPAHPVTVTSGERRHVDLVLHAAAIRGQLDATAVPLRDRSFVEARLCPIADAAENDVGIFLGNLPPAHSQPKCALGPDGAFAFECLPPGGYVLRIGNSIEPDLVHRIVYTTGDEAHELGVLTIPRRHTVKVATNAPTKGFREVHAMLPTPGNVHGVYVGAGGHNDGMLDLYGLPPGTYRLLLLVPDQHWGSLDQRVQATAEITVSDDGTVTPAHVTFTAKK